MLWYRKVHTDAKAIKNKNKNNKIIIITTITARVVYVQYMHDDINYFLKTDTKLDRRDAFSRTANARMKNIVQLKLHSFVHELRVVYRANR